MNSRVDWALQFWLATSLGEGKHWVQNRLGVGWQLSSPGKPYLLRKPRQQRLACWEKMWSDPTGLQCGIEWMYNYFGNFKILGTSNVSLVCSSLVGDGLFSTQRHLLHGRNVANWQLLYRYFHSKYSDELHFNSIRSDIYSYDTTCYVNKVELLAISPYCNGK